MHPAPPLRPLITISQGGWPVGQVGQLVSQRLSEASALFVVCSRVIWIGTTAIFQSWRYTITIHLFGTVPLQFSICLKYTTTYPFDMFLKKIGPNYPYSCLPHGLAPAHQRWSQPSPYSPEMEPPSGSCSGSPASHPSSTRATVQVRSSHHPTPTAISCSRRWPIPAPPTTMAAKRRLTTGRRGRGRPGGRHHSPPPLTGGRRCAPPRHLRPPPAERGTSEEGSSSHAPTRTAVDNCSCSLRCIDCNSSIRWRRGVGRSGGARRLWESGDRHWDMGIRVRSSRPSCRIARGRPPPSRRIARGSMSRGCRSPSPKEEEDRG
jgi:hypothetical protein